VFLCRANRVCLPHVAVFVLQLHDPTEDSARAIVPRASLSQRSKPPARVKRLREKLHRIFKYPLRRHSFRFSMVEHP